jgi:hypothetical protein
MSGITSEKIDPSRQLVPTPKDRTAAERQRRCRERKSRRDAEPVTRDDATLLCAAQAQIEIGFNDRRDALLTQKSWPDDDVTIVVARENIGEFIDRLTDALGIPSIGRRE